MAMQFSVSGMDELLQKMDQLPEKAAKVAARALYDGAGVVADKVSREVHGIKTQPFKYAKAGEKRKPSPEEKEIVEKAKHGIAKFKNSGTSVDTSVGFQNSGYGAITWNHARTNTRTKYKVDENNRARHASMGSGTSSKPVPLIVNSINSGTSFMEKQPFLRKAFSQSQKAAEAAIEASILAYGEMLDLD